MSVDMPTSRSESPLLYRTACSAPSGLFRKSPLYSPRIRQSTKTSRPGASKALRLLSGLIFIHLLVEAQQITEVAPGWAATSVNAVIFRKNSLATVRRHQYIAFYDPEGRAVLGMRKHGALSWELQPTPYWGNVLDAHNSISIMPDGRGYLHMAWDHHNNRLHYAVSTVPGSLQMGPMAPMTGSLEDTLVTYPEFYRLPGGDLLFAYRYGSSGSGNVVLNRYDVRMRSWKRLHDNLIDGEGRRNAYWQMAVDRKGWLHLSWVWRDSPDVATNHRLCYARSADGGKNWTRSDGSPLVVPITYATAEVVADIPQNSNLINQTSMTADAAGRPAIASYWTAAGDTVPQFFVAWHDGNIWQLSQASDRTTPFSLAGGGTRRIPVSRPQILAAGSGIKTRLYLIWRDAEAGNRIVLARALASPDMSWTRRVVEGPDLGQWEPAYDTELWRKKRTLSLFVQRVGQGEGGERPEQLGPQPVNVYEWSAGEFENMFE